MLHSFPQKIQCCLKLNDVPLLKRFEFTVSADADSSVLRFARLMCSFEQYVLIYSSCDT